ncbi:hypothetical protein ID0467_10300 [Helicobacter pylori]
MKTSQSKKSNPKIKGSVLNASLVLKNFLKQKPNPPTQQNKNSKKKIKKKQKKKKNTKKKKKKKK